MSRVTKRVAKPTVNAADNVTVEFGYDGQSNLAWVKDGRQNTTDLCYDRGYSGDPLNPAKGLLTRRIAPPPSPGANRPVTLYQYDATGNLTQVIPPRGVSSGPTVTCSTSPLMERRQPCRRPRNATQRCPSRGVS